jgi:hypothetical protein
MSGSISQPGRTSKPLSLNARSINPMPVQSDNTIRSGSSAGRLSPIPGWILSVGVFLVLYVLSTGPVVRLSIDMSGPLWQVGDAWSALEVIYAPLIFLAERFSLVSDFFEWYLGFWGI